MTENRILDGPTLFQLYFEEVMLRFASDPSVEDPISVAMAFSEELNDSNEFPRQFEQALNFMTAVLQGESEISKVLEQSGSVYELGTQLQGDLHSQELQSEMRLPWATFAILSDEMQSNYLKGLTRWFTLGEERPELPQIPRD